MSDLQKIHEESKKLIKELRQQYPDEYKNNTTQSNKEEYYDSPYTMENGTATFFYIVTMVIGTLFIDRWLIYITATFIYIMFKRRHKKKK